MSGDVPWGVGTSGCCEAVKQARRSMGSLTSSHGIQGFVAVGGKRAQGQALYRYAKRHYRALKRRTPRCWCCRINLRVAGECAPGLCAMCSMYSSGRWEVQWAPLS